MSAHRDRDLGRLGRGSRFQDETGSILVLFAVLLTLFLLVGAVVIDVGYWWANAKKAQIAADACALAAARDLPQDWGPPNGSPRTECGIGGTEYVLTNLPDQSDPNRGVKHLWTRVVTPYKGQSHRVEATVRIRVRTFFGKIVGSTYFDIERRAVAERQTGHGTMAIYVNSRLCDPGKSLEFDGQDMHIAGWVHTEGGLKVSVAGQPQPDFTADRGTMALDPANPQQTRCQESINPVNQAADFVPGHPDYLPEGIDPIDWPVWYTPSQFGWYEPAVAPPVGPLPNRCRFKGNKIEVENDDIKIDGNVVVSNHLGVLPTGIYCARETFSINGNRRFTGKITALAEEIKVNPSQNGLDLEAYAGSPDPVLFFTIPNSTFWPGPGGAGDDNLATLVCSHTKELQFNADNSTWTGVVFNPCTRTIVDQSNSDGTGSIITKQLLVNGNGFNFTGKENFTATIQIGLYE
jgi:Putative Flp pilus-assembly TadE/G-like